MLRRRTLFSEQSGEPIEPTESLYPFVDGTHSFGSQGSVTVTNGNHVAINITSNGWTRYICLSDVTKNGTSMTSSSNIRQDMIFTLHTGDICRFIVKNIQYNGDSNFGLNLRKANANTSLSFNTGNSSSVETRDVTVIMDENIDVGCVFIQISSPSDTDILEFDVEFYVNNVRWI